MAGASTVTVICADEVTAPVASLITAVIVVEPAPVAVTSPVASTVATSGSADDHSTNASGAPDGDVAATNMADSPTCNRTDVGVIVTGEVGGSVTVTAAVPVTPVPSFAVAVIVVEPAPMPLTRPAASTVATSGSADDQPTDASEASDGETVATSVMDSPTWKVACGGDTLIADTWTGVGMNVMFTGVPGAGYCHRKAPDTRTTTDAVPAVSLVIYTTTGAPTEMPRSSEPSGWTGPAGDDDAMTPTPVTAMFTAASTGAHSLAGLYVTVTVAVSPTDSCGWSTDTAKSAGDTRQSA